MPQTIKELQEERGEQEAKLRELQGVKETLSDEQEADLRGIIEVMEKVDVDLDLAMRSAKLLKRTGEKPPGAPEGGEHLGDAGFREYAETASSQRRDAEEQFGAMIQRMYGRESDVELRLQEMQTGSKGGFLVPEQFAEELLMFDGEGGIVRPRATIIGINNSEHPDAAITYPRLDQGAKGVRGGVVVQWTEEGGAKQPTEWTLGQLRMEPNELAGYIPLTDKLLRNARDVGIFSANMIRAAIAAEENEQFIAGDGVGKPIGFKDAPATLVVPRTTAGKITHRDAVTMMSKVNADRMTSAVFIAHQSAFVEIALMEDGSGRSIFGAGDASKGIPTTLLGRPILWTGVTSTLGSKGDLYYIDLKDYWIKDGAGPFIESSQHVLFLDNKTVVKGFWNVDGKPWTPEALTLDDGVTVVSPYVVLGLKAA